MFGNVRKAAFLRLTMAYLRVASSTTSSTHRAVLIAAERVGRVCYGIEIDPLYVDMAIRAGKPIAGAMHAWRPAESFAQRKALASAAVKEMPA